MAMKTNKNHKTIHEDFPLEIWEEINKTKNNLGMTWYEFLPHAAECAKVGFTKEEYHMIFDMLCNVQETSDDETIYPLCKSASQKAFNMWKKMENEE